MKCAKDVWMMLEDANKNSRPVELISYDGFKRSGIVTALNDASRFFYVIWDGDCEESYIPARCIKKVKSSSKNKMAKIESIKEIREWISKNWMSALNRFLQLKKNQ